MVMCFVLRSQNSSFYVRGKEEFCSTAVHETPTRRVSLGHVLMLTFTPREGAGLRLGKYTANARARYLVAERI